MSGIEKPSRGCAANVKRMADKDTKNFTAVERAAMKQRAAEVKAEKANKTREAGQAALDKAIADMTEPDKTLASTFARIVGEVAPELDPKTYYGFPAFARDGKVLCFFQPTTKFGTRYPTIAFEDRANLDDGNLWPVAYGVGPKLTAADEKRITEIVTKAVG
jgi:uncharacterized protein YdhG (YjbR/CyaY superfamily)